MDHPSWLKDHIRDIPDFPKPGVVFKDITPLLGAPDAFQATVDAVCEPWESVRIDKVLGVEARGFIVAAPVAYRFGAGFVPVRKAGKLPWEIEREEYELEYGTDLLEIHRDAVQLLQPRLLLHGHQLGHGAHQLGEALLDDEGLQLLHRQARAAGHGPGRQATGQPAGKGEAAGVGEGLHGRIVGTD